MYISNLFGNLIRRIRCMSTDSSRMYGSFLTLLVFLFVMNGCVFRTSEKRNCAGCILLKELELDGLQSIPFDSLIVTDPFVLADEATQTYYLTGSGGTMWKSTDLHSWLGPFAYLEVDTTSWIGANPMIWAPELHYYKGRYYCFVTFTNTDIVVEEVPDRYNVLRRGTHILVAERAEGPYRLLSATPYFPENWSILDGTLFEEEGVPYMVFNHDWMQLETGQIKQIELAEDLSHSVGGATSLFSANDAPWPREMQSIGELTFGMSLSGYVSDGPFLFRTETGRLGMLWSSWSDRRYAQGVAYSESGRLEGPWVQQEQPLVNENAGHGMLFTTFDGKKLLSLHYQLLDDNPGPRRPMFFEVDLTGDSLEIIGRYNP